jgi:hypothetical protein
MPDPIVILVAMSAQRAGVEAVELRNFPQLHHTD